MTTGNITWLRAEWLWALIPLLILAFVWFRQQKIQSAWEQLVDAELQPYVIDGEQQKRRVWPYVLFLSWFLSVLLLAGPVWERQEVPVFQAQQAEVILFDLSRSMQSDDVPPDRLTRARFKLLDLLRRSQGRQSALVVFTERPYTISPLTEDAATVEAFVPSLTPDIMPVQGSRLDLAIDRAVELLSQSGVVEGHIIAITDAQVADLDLSAARAAREAGHRLSILAVGTSTGSPLKNEQGQFVQRQNGAIVVPRIDMQALQGLASVGGGLATGLTTNDDDLEALERIRRAIAIDGETDKSDLQADYWIEYAPWCLWLLVVVMLYAFRRGVAV